MIQKNLDNKEEEIYSAIRELKKSDNSDREVAYECLGILRNESTKEPFESRLNIVEEKIKEYLKNKNSNN